MKKAVSIFSAKAIREAEKESKDFKSRTKFVWMDPKTFLQIAEKLKFGPDKAKQENVEKYIPHEDIPMLLIHREDLDIGNMKAFQCIGHEGRHRAIYIRDNNLGLMPVRIRCSVTRWKEDEISGNILIKGQSDNTYRKVKI